MYYYPLTSVVNAGIGYDYVKGGILIVEELSLQEQYYIKQIAATMEIEDMPLDKQTIENLRQLAAGEKTADQLIREIKKEYANG